MRNALKSIAILCLTLLGVSIHSTARAISYPVSVGSTQIGQVTVNILDSGLQGGFSSTYGSPRSLSAAAGLGSDHHFNWFQVITADNDAPNNVGGVKQVPPYIDPPLGGYGVPDTQWADGLPWLWDEGADPPPGTPGFDDGYNLLDVLDDFGDSFGHDGVDDFLFFEDFPGGFTGSSVSFKTWLVSVGAGGTLHDFYGGFQWTWSNPTGGDGSTQILAQSLPAAQGLTLYQQLVFPDFNQNNTIDAGDYVAWRKNSPATYTASHYTSWRAHFGQTVIPASGADATVSSAIPEPATALLLVTGLLAITSCRSAARFRVNVI